MKLINTLKIVFLAVLLAGFISCSNNDDIDAEGDTIPPQEENIFATYSINDLSKSGRITIELGEDNKIRIRVELDVPTSTDNTIKIYDGHFDGTDLGTSNAYLTLNPILSGETESITEVHQSDNGTTITYEDLISTDRHLRVLTSSDLSLSINVFTDIGTNAFMQQAEKSYMLIDTDSNIIGTTHFLPRNNNHPMLVSVTLNNRDEMKEYYPFIITGSEATGDSNGEVISTLSKIYKFGTDTEGGNTSFTNLSEYTTPLAIDNGFITVKEEATDGNEVGRCDVGGNELTGNFNDYILNNAVNENLQGIVKLQERINGTTLVGYQMIGGEHNPQQNCAISLLRNNHIQLDGDRIADLKQYEAGSSAVFYTDITGVKYNELISTDNHVRMYQGLEQNADYYVVSDIGTAAPTGNEVVTSIDFGLSGSVPFSLSIKLEERVNTMSESIIEFSEHVDQTYYVDIYEGINPLDEEAAKIVNFGFYETSDKMISYRDVHSGSDGKQITFEEITGGKNHYRVYKNRSENPQERILVGYGIIE